MPTPYRGHDACRNRRGLTDLLVHPTPPPQAIRREFLDNPEGLDLHDFVRVMVKYLDVEELKDMDIHDLDLHTASASGERAKRA